MATLSWISFPVGGDWTDAADWSTSTVPTASDDVSLTVPVTVTLSTDAVVNSLTLGAPGQSESPVVLDVTGSLSTQHLVIFGAELELEQDASYDGGTISLGTVLPGDLSGTAYGSDIEVDGALTLGASETLLVASNFDEIFGTGSVVNLGTIAFAATPPIPPAAGFQLALLPATFSNAGMISIGDASLSLADQTQFSNTGTISLDTFGTLTLWVNSDLGHITQAEGTIVGGGTIVLGLNGSIDNTGSVFDISQANADGVTGFAGILSGGTIVSNGGELYYAAATLDSVTLVSSLTGLPRAGTNGSSLSIVNGLTVDGPATIDGVTVTLGNITTDSTVTLGPQATLLASTDAVSLVAGGTGSIINEGAISIGGPTLSESDIDIVAPSFNNDLGNIGVFSNCLLSIVSTDFSNSGVITIAGNGTLDLALQATLAGLPATLGSITNSSGANNGVLDITLIGTIANAGTVFDAAAANASHVTGFGNVLIGSSFAKVAPAVLVGGSLDEADGSLTFTHTTLDGVAVLGPLTLGSDDLTFSNGTHLTGASGTGAGTIEVTAAGPDLTVEGTLDNATIEPTASLAAGLGSLGMDSPDTLTLGANLLVDVPHFIIEDTPMTHNLGTIRIEAGAGGFAVMDANPGITSDLVNDGLISIGLGGEGIFSNSYSGTGTIQLLGSADLDFNAASSGNVQLVGTGNTIFFAVAAFAGTIGGLAIGDALHFPDVISSASYADGAVSVFNDGSLVTSIAVSDDLSGDTFPVTQGLVTVACFAAGTRIATLRGEIAVEALRLDDRVVLASGGDAPVRWLGHRTLNCLAHPRPHDVWPVRIHADAFAPGRPRRDLVLSPDHAVRVAGALVPVRYLVNGATIVQEQQADITYWHVELPTHDIMLAENMPTESYLDTGNRSAFANGGDALTLHPNFARPNFAREVWQREGCAPLVMAGRSLAAARRHLLSRATALGHAATDDPALQVTSAGRHVRAIVNGNQWRMLLPRDSNQVRIMSRTWTPAHVRPDEDDTRILGVALANLRIDGRPLLLDEASLSGGWHAVEPEWRWTTGDARLAVDDVRELSFDVVLSGRYWTEPKSVAHRFAGG